MMRVPWLVRVKTRRQMVIRDDCGNRSSNIDAAIDRLIDEKTEIAVQRRFEQLTKNGMVFLVMNNRGSMEVRVGDSYIRNKGFTGPFAGANARFFDYSLQFSGADAETLSNELRQLRTAMVREAAASPESGNVELVIAAGEVASAERAAQSSDISATTGHLKSAGKWALDMATKIGTSVAARAIENAIGL